MDVFNDNNSDLCLDLSLDLDQNVDSGDEGQGFGEVDIELSLDSGLDFSSDGFDLSIDDGTTLSFSLEDDSEEIELNAASLLGGVADVSYRLRDYYKWSHSARQKLSVMLQSAQVERMVPTMLDFDFITDIKERQLVYGYVCQMLDDLTTDKRYADFSTEEAYEAARHALFEELHWTPNVHAERFYQVFVNYYEKNRRLSSVGEIKVNTTISQTVDLDAVRYAERVYYINSVPFQLLSRFTTDPAYTSEHDIPLKTASYGHFMSYVAEKTGKRAVTPTDVREGITSFLTGDDTLRYIGVSVEQALEFSTGELFRRFMVKEMEEGLFMPNGIVNLAGREFSDELLYEEFNILIASMRQDSISAEILALVLTILRSLHGKSVKFEMLIPLTLSTISYLAAFYTDRSMLHPVFYGYVGETESLTGEPMLEIGYEHDGDMQTTTLDNVLCKVVGDATGSFCVPLVYEDRLNSLVVCPPLEVAHQLFSVTGPSRVAVNGEISYDYRPTYEWLSTLSLASMGRDTSGELHSSNFYNHEGNPMLSVLRSYTNKFRETPDNVKVITMDAPGSCKLIGLQSNPKEPVEVCRLEVPGLPRVLDSASFIIDDGSAIVRYVVPGTGGEQVIVLEPGDFTSSVVSSASGDAHLEVPDFEKLFPSTTSAVGFEEETYYRAVVKLLCDRAALDYGSLLEDAKVKIARELFKVTHHSAIDTMVGTLILRQYLELIEKNNGTLDGFNFDTLKEVTLFVAGDGNALAYKKEMDDEVVHILEDIIAEGSMDVKDYARELDKLDFHLLAFQALSPGELSGEPDMQRYQALHYFPEFNARFRTLENQIVLLQALYEMGDDIAHILRKKSALYSVYSKVCTKDTVGSLEVKLKTGMKCTGEPRRLSATRQVLSNTLMNNFAILKYFALEHNMYGVLTGLEEVIERGNTGYRDIYTALREDIPMLREERVSLMSEEDFRKVVPNATVDTVFDEHPEVTMQLLCDGLVAEVASGVSLQVILAYDILTYYGRELFNLEESARENFNQVDDYANDFFSYLGSLIVSYCPVTGEAIGDIDGGLDRFSAYVRHREDFKGLLPMEQFERYRLRDTHLVHSGQLTEEELFGVGGQ